MTEIEGVNRGAGMPPPGPSPRWGRWAGAERRVGRGETRSVLSLTADHPLRLALTGDPPRPSRARTHCPTSHRHPTVAAKPRSGGPQPPCRSSCLRQRARMTTRRAEVPRMPAARSPWDDGVLGARVTFCPRLRGKWPGEKHRVEGPSKARRCRGKWCVSTVSSGCPILQFTPLSHRLYRLSC